MKITPSIADFSNLLWSRKASSLDFEKDKIYIVHQVLSFGSLDQVKKLIKLYSKKEVIRVFNQYPKKNYTPASFNFVKKIILGLETARLSHKNYVKAIS